MKTSAMSLCTALATLALATGTPASTPPLPPHVEFRPVHTSQLHLGMTAAEVLRIMGPASQTNTSGDDVQVLTFSATPIPAKVVLTRAKVSSISLDTARVDEARLPEFTNKALVGMSSMGVREFLGAPTDVRNYQYFGVRLDQLIFERANAPLVSIFFVEDRVVTKTLGFAVPVDIFGVVLPARPDSAAHVTAVDSAVIGASARDLQTVFGTPKLQVDYRFNGQPAAHVIYQTHDGHTLSVYLVGGVATEITDVGVWSLDDAPGA